MLAFRHVADAVASAFALRAAANRAGLPPLHIGLTAGPVVERDGDYFGRTVNLASRLSEVAGPGEILANETAAGVEPGLRVTPVGPTEIKGLLAPILLFRIDGIGPA
jgi:class 3 adenylate cyclase